MPTNASGGGGRTPSTYYANPGQFGEYQFIYLSEIIENFTAAYIGEGKILQNALKGDISFHAHRALQELHYDTLKSCKDMEIEVCPSLKMPVPNDYVNYIKLAWTDSNGIEHVIYPATKTSNPDPASYLHDFNCADIPTEDDLTSDCTLLSDDGDHRISIAAGVPGCTNDIGNVVSSTSQTNDAIEDNTPANHSTALPDTCYKCNEEDGYTLVGYSGSNYCCKATANGTAYINSTQVQSTTWDNYKGSSSNQVAIDQSTTTDPAVDADNYFQNTGKRYGIDPQYAQANGSYFIDCSKGVIHFSSNLSGKTLVLKYLSDGHGTDDEMMVHKFAEEAMYKWIAYGCLSARIDIPEHVVQRFKKEKFAETRKSKIRLSNIKIEEIAQIMRGKSKFIKH